MAGVQTAMEVKSGVISRKSQFRIDLALRVLQLDNCRPEMDKLRSMARGVIAKVLDSDDLDERANR